ncbi:alpha/beta hydrolase [Butyrivibrio proteoclasticus]|uniref:alpha/beta hydrolase n=1 Tax=Butyrivibrio proteoclasticus TaxID=43305 RepID=UPI00055032F4|nr:alpha/beta hydrolase [Butyrivibrio proteoclasticus]
MANKALIYIHGKGGTASASEQFKSFFPDHDTFGFDYKSDNPWEAESEFKEYFIRLSEKYTSITVLASSLGAYFLMISGAGVMIQKAFLVSPIVDMERLIQDMMKYANVSEDDLKSKSTIHLSDGAVLSWDYLVWVKNHPIVWNVPTFILFGEKDHLQSLETMQTFAEAVGADLTVMPNGEHWFHTDEQTEFRNRWLLDIAKENESLKFFL